MRAKHKYNPKHREGARRIAQSYGYKHTINDDPKMIQLLARAGIYLDGIDYDTDTTATTFTDNVVPAEYIADTETVKL